MGCYQKQMVVLLAQLVKFQLNLVSDRCITCYQKDKNTYYSTTLQECEECPNHQILYSTRDGCENCPDHYHVGKNAEGLKVCKPCDEGTYRSENAQDNYCHQLTGKEYLTQDGKVKVVLILE